MGNSDQKTADSITQAATAMKSKGPAPVHLWNPEFCGDLDMRIARDGTWYYLGSPIGRKPLVKLFSNILRKDGDKYFLVTPVEKVGIIVDDAPFVAVDFDVTGTGANQQIYFVTNVGDRAIASTSHPLRVHIDPQTGEPSPYVMIRNNLEALIDRKSFYRLLDLVSYRDINGENWCGVWSGGAFFPLTLSSDLE